MSHNPSSSISCNVHFEWHFDWLVDCIEDYNYVLRYYSDISAISRLGSRRLPISEIVAARPGIESRTSFSESQELNCYTTDAPDSHFDRGGAIFQGYM